MSQNKDEITVANEVVDHFKDFQKKVEDDKQYKATDAAAHSSERTN